MPRDTKLYDVLGVKPGATMEEIDDAYTEAKRVYHPDKKTGSNEKFYAAKDTYDVLSNAGRRSQYDDRGFEYLGFTWEPFQRTNSTSSTNSGNSIPINRTTSSSSTNSQSNNPPNFTRNDSTSSQNANNNHNTYSNGNAPYKNGNNNSTTNYNQRTNQEWLSSSYKANNFNGTPNSPNFVEDEESKVFLRIENNNSKASQDSNNDDRSVTTSVNGTKKEPKMETVVNIRVTLENLLEGFKIVPMQIKNEYGDQVRSSVRVPLQGNAKSGDVVKVEGCGHYIKTSGTNQTILFRLKVQEHERFTRNENNLCNLILKQKIRLSFKQSIIGFTVSFISLDGTIVSIDKSQPLLNGQKMIVKNHGLPQKNATDHNGTVEVAFAVEYPNLDEFQKKELAKKLDKLGIR
ncbi:hypothetical protein DFJ63DRAFT_312804 [Scheffersomyces coipomensis]|uniref:uncharacterized protein n=1 Tax=Scheffersomyces coipomensis TaxID=1788519 RepID=UPI00315D44E1